MITKEQKKTVNIRVLRDTRDRLKVKAARRKKTIMQLIEELSRQKHDPVLEP